MDMGIWRFEYDGNRLLEQRNWCEVIIAILCKPLSWCARRVRLRGSVYTRGANAYDCSSDLMLSPEIYLCRWNSCDIFNLLVRTLHHTYLNCSMCVYIYNKIKKIKRFKHSKIHRQYTYIYSHIFMYLFRFVFTLMVLVIARFQAAR